MFGFSLAAQLFQGSAQRTWNCVSQFTNLLWYKFNHYRYPAMPRSRRRHHSRSRSRSRSHSHDRDRDVKRRKLDNVDSPAQKRSVSSEPQSPEPDEVTAENVKKDVQQQETSNVALDKSEIQVDSDSETEPEEKQNPSTSVHEKPIKKIDEKLIITPKKAIQVDSDSDSVSKETETEEKQNPSTSVHENPIKKIEEKLIITPKKALSPKHVQKKLESEKKRQQKQQEREERERKKQEEKERLLLEKEQARKEKEESMKKKNEQKAKEREMKEEQKRKEKEEKEAKRKEKEEREEAKRKEREQEKNKKQQELDEKNREKQKLEEQKQKAAQVFANFFVPKKTEAKLEERKTKLFMPFEVKSDMRLPPMRRDPLTTTEKQSLIKSINSGDSSYLKDIKDRKNIRKCAKTWPYEEDVVIIEEDFGESICEDKQKSKKMRVKFLKFRENRRPAYYGTWRKKSGLINSRKPHVEDKSFFDYEVDSDDDWEEEEQGESLNGSDDEDNDAENDDYEVDNEFFVPHGHLSDDEVDDEASAKLSPESHKQKLKLLKDEFDQDMQAKTNRKKPRSIGCIWYSKDRSNTDDAIDRHLRPLAAIIADGHVVITKRKDFIIGSSTPSRRNTNQLRPELIPTFLKLIQGNVNKKSSVVEEFMNYMRNNDYVVEVSKSFLLKCLKQYAQWKKCADEGPLFNKYCWCLEEEVKKKYNFE